MITFFFISLSHFLATFPSYSRATCQSNVKITFYGWPDNGGNAKVRGGCGRTKAGGIGTYEDPLTFAAADGVYSNCEIIYVPYLQKFARYEDSCGACINDKANGHGIHIDIFIGSNKADGGSLVTTCESNLTPDDKQTIIRRGGNGFPVNTRPLFEVPMRYPTKGTCHPEYTHLESGRELCQTATSEAPNIATEFEYQYNTADVNSGDDTPESTGPSAGTDVGQGLIKPLDSVNGQSIAANSDQISTQGNGNSLFANLDANLDNWDFFNSDILSGTNQYAKQNTDSPVTVSTTEDSTLPNANFDSNLVSLGPSTAFGDTLFADNSLPSILDTDGSGSTNNNEADNNIYYHDSVLPI